MKALINALLSLLFRRKVELEADFSYFDKIRNFANGVTLFNLDLDVSFYVGDHSPRLEFGLIIFNHMIFSIDIYNILSYESQQIVDLYTEEELATVREMEVENV